MDSCLIRMVLTSRWRKIYKGGIAQVISYSRDDTMISDETYTLGSTRTGKAIR
jgi:hypothetical protein